MTTVKTYSQPAMTAQAVKTYAATGRLHLDSNGEVIHNGTDDPGAELTRRAKTYMSQHRDVSFSDALAAVTHRDADAPGLLRSYATQQYEAPTANAPTTTTGRQPSSPAMQASNLLDVLARQHMDCTGERNYAAAVQHVMRANPAAARTYVNGA